MAEFKKVQPQKKIQDALFLDTAFRPGAKTVLARKLENTKAPVFNYIFAYEYPINGGITSFHCAELAFAFHALSDQHIRLATGATPAGLALQDKVSQAWVNFARTGNPSQPGLPWKPYTVEGKETMVFDTISEVAAWMTTSSCHSYRLRRSGSEAKRTVQEITSFIEIRQPTIKDEHADSIQTRLGTSSAGAGDASYCRYGASGECAPVI